MVQLDDRKKKILQAIIDAYIDTAEPVGSRTVSKNYKLGLSPATIRNEMMDLEDMGFLEQPHTSAGRVPSQTGYRFYVDSLMKRYRMSVEEMEGMNRALKTQFNELGDVLDYAGRVISHFTNYTAVASAARLGTVNIRKLDIIKVDAITLLAVVLTNDDIVKNKLIRLKAPISKEEFIIVRRILAEAASGKGMKEFTKGYINSIKERFALYGEAVCAPLEFAYEVLMERDCKADIFLTGVRRILEQPEFSTIEKAREFLAALEDKKRLQNIIFSADGTDEPAVLIGGEIGTERLKDASFVVCRYDVGYGIEGIVGIIGPTRMDYAKVLSNMEYFTKHFSEKMLGNNNDNKK